MALESQIMGMGVKIFFCSDFDENLFLGQFDHADSESGLSLSIRALGGTREQKKESKKANLTLNFDQNWVIIHLSE